MPPAAIRWSRRYRPPSTRPVRVPMLEWSLRGLCPGGPLPRHADDPRPTVCPDDCSDESHADFVAREARCEQIEELVEVGRFAMAHTQSFHGRLLEQTVREPSQCFLSRSCLAGFFD